MSSALTQLEDRGGVDVPAVLPEPGEHTVRCVELRSHGARVCVVVVKEGRCVGDTSESGKVGRKSAVRGRWIGGFRHPTRDCLLVTFWQE
jgi:hypothetical protein